MEGSEFKFNNGKSFKIKESSNCSVKNVIYVIKCRGCGLEYIGETGDKLRNRVTVHNQQDENLRVLKVSKHLAACPKTDPKYEFFPFYKMTN